MAITYVGKGDFATGNVDTPPAPVLPAGIAVHDLLLALFYGEDTVDQVVGISPGWTQLYNERTAGGLLALWYRFMQPGDVAPSFTIGPEFTAGASVAQIAAWRAVAVGAPNLGSLVTTGPAADVGPVPAITFPANSLMLIAGGMLRGIGNAADPSPGDVDWHVVDAVSPIGLPFSMEWYYEINGGSPVTPGSQTMIFSAFPSARGKATMLSFNAGTGFHPAVASNYRRRR